MRYLILAVLISSCADDKINTESASILTLSFAKPELVTDHLNAVATAARHAVATAQFVVSLDAADLMITEDGRALFSLLVACALPSDVILTTTIDGFDIEFFGEMGLAPQWLQRQLIRTEERWISSCMFSRINMHNEEIVVSMRGDRRQLRTSHDERVEFPLQEGAFWGNMLAESLDWHACRGEGLKMTPLPGGLIDRDCAKPDPLDPQKTMCGMRFAGDCSDVCDSQRRHCEHSSEIITTYVAQ